MKDKKLGALLLAGGNSRRMGQSKAMLPFGNGTFLSQTAAMLDGLEERLLSTGQERLSVPGWKSVLDVVPNRGPLGGIYSALLQCHSDALMVLACDLPNIPRQLVDYLTSFSDAGWKAWAIKSRDGRVQPLCGVYTRECLPVFEQMLAEKNGCMMELLERTEAHILDAVYTVFPDTAFLNINTPQEYHKLKIPAVVAVCGAKNSGKTTLCEKIVACYTARGLRVGICKHDGHSFIPDVPRTDSFRLRTAGADPVAVMSSTISMIIASDGAFLRQLSLWNQCDLVLLEGFKGKDYPKIEIVRRGNSIQQISNAPMAIATDIPGWQADCTVLDLNNTQMILNFIDREILHLPR